MSALIALLNAASKRGGAAIANVAQGFSLLARKYGVPACQELAVVSADDVGHLGPTWAHRSMGVKSRSRESSGLDVERTARSATCR
jgi:hypothetical protein